MSSSLLNNGQCVDEVICRRKFLSRAGLGLGGIALGELLGAREVDDSAAHFRPRARRVVHFFLNGGPSQVDTFDPKPALMKYAGQPLPSSVARITERKTGSAMPSPFTFRRFGKSGLEVSELFERTARDHADDIAVIRSMQAQVPNHEPSLMLMNCGDGLQARPSVGAWLMYGLGVENRSLPGFIAMCPGGLPIKGSENWQSGFLPGAYQGTYLNTRESDVERLLENIRNESVPQRDQRRQVDFLRGVNARFAVGRGSDSRLAARMESFELAFRMQTEATDAFDISRESTEVRAMYGDTVHGRQTLMARRLLERGVRYVQLWHGAGQPWDNHDQIESNHRRLAADIDGPIAALMTDLKRLGMFEDTLILWGGEFGRTPSVEMAGAKSKLGRDHNHYGFSVWMAGGGVRGGQSYGATDEFGFAAVDRPVSVHDLHATMLHLMGLDHERLTFRHSGRDFRLTDVHGSVLRELLA
jgi:hypothetical protein